MDGLTNNGVGNAISIGNNNKVTIANKVKIQHCNITLKGDNIMLTIGNNVEITGLVISMFQNCGFTIDNSTTMSNGEITIAEDTRIDIGKDCMFAHGYEIRTSDMHPIYSLKTGNRINYGKSITISNHIWAGKNITILKGL